MKNKIRLILILVIGICLIISIICIKYNLKTIFYCIPPYKFVSRLNCRISWCQNVPDCLKIDSKGYIYVAYGGESVAKFSSDGKMIAKWQRKGDLPGQFKYIYNLLCVDSHDYIYATDAHGIQKFDNNGNFICVVYEREKHFYKSAFDINGNMFLLKRNTVEKFDCKGNFITKWRVVEYPFDIKIDSKGDVYVASSLEHRVEIPEADRSKGVYDEDGNYYVEDEILTYDSYIYKFDSLGKVLHKNLYMKKNNKNAFMKGIALDSRGNFFILEGLSILMYDNKGNFIGKFGSYGFRNGCFQDPIDIEVDKENNIYVLDRITHYIHKFSPK